MALKTARELAWKSVLGALAALGVAASAHATTQGDAPNDFLAAYTGPHVDYEDVISVSARISGGNVFLDATMNGAIDATAQANALYVWGINRGAGAQLFPFGPGIIFDSVVVLNPADLSANVVRILPGPPNNTLHPGAVTISGATISTVIPLADLPSEGRSIQNYGFSFWPRYINTTQPVSDFAPDARTFPAQVPEPRTWGLVIVGLGLTGAALRRRQKSAARVML